MEGLARVGNQYPPMSMFGSNCILLSHRRRIELYLLIMATCSKDCSSVRKSITIAALLIFGKTSALIISKQPLHLSHHFVERQQGPPNRSRAKAWLCHPKALNLEAKSTLPHVNTGGILESEESVSRKDVIAGLCAAALSITASMCQANTEINLDGLGVVDDLLANCPSTPTCVSSQDDRPYPFMEPWTYEGHWDRAMSRLRSYLELDGAKVVASSPRYLRVEFEAVDALTSSVDDAEFYFTPGDALVQFRCARRSGFTDFGASRRRMDSIRIALQFESIPVLRNRKRTFIFGESPIDSFGPSFGNVDPSLIYGDTDPLSPPFENPSDSMRERVEGSVDRPVWWGKPLAEARGFADWEQPRRAPC